jgi:hypothetical protein
MLRLNVKTEEYIDKLVEYCNMKIYAIATVVDTNETWGEEDDFQVLKPNLDITVSARYLAVAVKIQTCITAVVASVPSFKEIKQGLRQHFVACKSSQGGLHYVSIKFFYKNASLVSWPEFLAADPQVPGSIPGSTRFFFQSTGSTQPLEDK